MTHHEHHPLDAFELELAGLSPALGGLSRDRVMYLAGRAAADAVRPRRRSAGLRCWRMLSLAGAAVSLLLGGMLLYRESTRPAGAIVRQPRDVRPVPHSPPDDAPRENSELVHDDDNKSAEQYLHLRRRVLAGGVDALPDRKPRRASNRESDVWTSRSPAALSDVLDG